MAKTWFITGCSTGFGRLLSEVLIGMGENVVATARSVESLSDLGSSDDENILRLPLDVRNDVQIHEAVASSIEKFEQIDVLVNNAGYGFFATQEEGELNEVRAMFDTNVFGLIAMSQAVIPHMRLKNTGTIVNISSVAGRITTPRGGFYQSSKWAVEAISESQYLELSSFGIRVIVIEPGAYETDFGPRSARLGSSEEDPRSPYSGLRERWRTNAGNHLFPHRQNPMEVVQGVIESVESGEAFIRLPIGADALELTKMRDEVGGIKFVEWMRERYHEQED